jgi:hypothetical protein
MDILSFFKNSLPKFFPAFAPKRKLFTYLNNACVRAHKHNGVCRIGFYVAVSQRISLFVLRSARRILRGGGEKKGGMLEQRPVGPHVTRIMYSLEIRTRSLDERGG